jgi:hypothetical protein
MKKEKRAAKNAAGSGCAAEKRKKAIEEGFGEWPAKPTAKTLNVSTKRFNQCLGRYRYRYRYRDRMINSVR